MFVALIDIGRFGSVPKKIVRNSLERKRVDIKLHKKLCNSQSAEFVTKERLRQGGVLIPAIFNIVMREIKDKIRKIQVDYRNMKIVELAEYAIPDGSNDFHKKQLRTT